MSLSAGSKLGPYDILSPIGAGGMGEVYRAKDSRLQRTVAIKILPTDLVGNANRLLRFQQEARAASSLNHPNIVTIYEIGSVDSVQFISMELVEGKSLREMLVGGALSMRKLIQVASQFADGLSKAHAAGIVHRDLKPENVMISKDGVVKILDFGLAKLTAKDSDSGSGPETRTDPDTVLGTAGYMSPEQAVGGNVDFRSDQFSFGSILYEMAMGKYAFKRATTPETLVAIIRDEPEPVTSMNAPAPLCWIIERCLAKDPEDRYASTRDLARDLQSLRDHISDITGSSKSDLKTVTPYWQKRYRLLTLLPVVLVAFLLAGAGAWKLFRSAEHQQPMVIRALTYSGVDSAPTATADGQLIAFTSRRDGQDRIWLRQMAVGNEVALTAGPDDNARFSPDGSTVLFTRREAGHNSLYHIPTLGGEPRKIVEDAESGDWSPDGKLIAFVRLEGRGEFENSILGIANADGTHLQVVSRVKKTTLQWPRWSRDGKWIVSNAFPHGNFKLDRAILVIDVKSKETKWLPAFATGHVSGVNWAGNSKQLLYEEQEMPIIGDRGLGPGYFLMQDIESGKIRTLFWYPSMAISIQRVNRNQLLFDSSSVHGNLREFPVTESSGSSARWLTRGNSNDRQPQYSPDGEWIIFSSDRNGNLDLWKLSTKSGGVRRITEDTAQDWDPTFTPDGKHILWSSDRNGHFEIYMTDADGNGARQVTSDGVDAENPTITPDGRWIVHSSYNPNKSGVWKMHPDGSGATRIYSGIVQVPEVSPDGKYVCVGMFKRTINESSVSLQVVRMEDGAHFELQPGVTNSYVASGGRCRWLPGGKQIAYLDRNEEGAWGIYVQDFIPGQDTKSSRKPVAGFDPDSPTESFGISPDGSHITICQREESSGLVLAENVPLD